MANKGPIRADVVIFGAGISGLTAAHELASRNFRVAIIDPDYAGARPQFPEAYEENPGVGGVARSQWGFLGNQTDNLEACQLPFPIDAPLRSTRPPAGTATLFATYTLTADGVGCDIPEDFNTRKHVGPAHTPHRERLRRALHPLRAVAGQDCDLVAVCNLRPVTPAEYEVFRSQYPAAVLKTELTKKQHERLLALLPDDLDKFNAVKDDLDDELRSALGEILDEEEVGKSQIYLALAPRLSDTGRLAAFARELAEGAPLSFQTGFEKRQPRGTILFYANQFAYPGEHGFRFFPSFYRHVFDTMKRIPLTDPFVPTEGADYLRQGRESVFDNLVAVDTVDYASDGKKPTLRLPRREIRSLEEMREIYRQFLSRVGLTAGDLKHLTRGFMKYATSSRRRREKQYESLSWYDFLEGDRLSERGRYLMETTPGALLALSGSQGDARSHGTIGLQCMSDQFSSGADSDMLLNGPTDSAWFGPWYRYLTLQGVSFFRGKLEGFTVAGEKIVPVVKLHGDDKPVSFEPFEADRPVYFILALPLIEAYRNAEEFRAHARNLQVKHLDFDRLCDFAGPGSPEKLRQGMANPNGSGPLRHMSGIQYFFNHDLRLWQAHTQYFDAPAGVTAVAQPQFWLESRDILSGYRSVLSVDICTWARPMRDGWPVPGTSPGGYGWGLGRDQLAQLIWDQIAAGHAKDFVDPAGNFITPPRPFLYHIDDNLIFDPGLSDNKTPYLVNQKGRYRLRPGEAGYENHKVKIEYQLAQEQYVLAGIYMQTYTRITSMEAACESGRHAANAILKAIQYRGEGCAIWDPEDFEPPDLKPLKELDDDLCARGLPHMLDITGASDDWSLTPGGDPWKRGRHW